jgi:hypothetical protein
MDGGGGVNAESYEEMDLRNGNAAAAKLNCKEKPWCKAQATSSFICKQSAHILFSS